VGFHSLFFDLNNNNHIPKGGVMKDMQIKECKTSLFVGNILVDIGKWSLLMMIMAGIVGTGVVCIFAFFPPEACPYLALMIFEAFLLGAIWAIFETDTHLFLSLER
jgi:hypothetical protein